MNILKSFVYALFAFITLLSCKSNDKNLDKSDISYLETEFKTTKADTTFNKLVQAYGKAIINSEDSQTKEALLIKAVELCNVPEKLPMKEVFAVELLKVNPNHKNAANDLYDLAESMESRNRKEAAAMLYDAFSQRFPNDKRANFASEKKLAEQQNHEEYFKNQAKKVLDNPNESGVNEMNTAHFIDMCETFAIAFPNDKMAPVYLFKGADMARAMGNTPKIMSLYDWVYTYYPKFEKAPLALFLRGFTLDSELGNFTEAKKAYEKFLAKYPQDSLAKDVQFLMNNLGKTPDQMYKEMQKAQ